MRFHPIAVILSTLCACSASSQRPSESATVRADARPPARTPALQLLPAPDPACVSEAPLVLYSARTSFASGGRATNTWSDFLVRGHAAPAKEGCERLVRLELEQARPADAALQVVLDRACDRAPLPAAEATRGAVTLLVQPNELPAPLHLAANPDECTTVVQVTISHMGSEKGCREMLAKIEVEHESAAEEAAEAAGAWLRRERQRLEQQTERACKAAQEATDRCQRMGGTEAELERACVDQKSKACEAARDRVLERGACDIERSRRVRECESARSMLDTIRKRETASPVRQPSKAFCHQPD